jgi:hypothetical protein
LAKLKTIHCVHPTHFFVFTTNGSLKVGNNAEAGGSDIHLLMSSWLMMSFSAKKKVFITP